MENVYKIQNLGSPREESFGMGDDRRPTRRVRGPRSVRDPLLQNVNRYFTVIIVRTRAVASSLTPFVAVLIHCAYLMFA